VSHPATPGHASVRVAPAAAKALVARWPQGCEHARCPRCHHRALTGTLLAADAAAPARWLEAADVIIAAGGEGISRPGEWLRRYPGCAVVASCTQPGKCLVAMRDGVLHRLTVSGQGAIHATALTCAVFVHGWSAAGWPLALLRPACLDVSQGVTRPAPEPGRRLFFRFSYCPAPEVDPLPGSSGSSAAPDSVSRTWWASGEPSAS
jgi:hypothetical protein